MSDPPPAPPRALIGLAVVLAAAMIAFLALRPRGAPAGNYLVLLNAGTAALDSVTVTPEPPGANLLSTRHGYLAPRDSAWIILPAATGDADVQVWRGGRVVADHAIYFGGQSVFEVRVGDRDQLGRYRRL